MFEKALLLYRKVGSFRPRRPVAWISAESAGFNSPRRLDTIFTPLLLLLSLILFFNGATAQAETRIAFVDIPYLIDKAPQTLEAERRLEMEFAPRQEDLRIQREKLASLNERLKLEALELSESELAELDRDTRGLERRLKRDEQDFREELNIQKNTEFKKVRILVLEAIAKFGKNNQYDLIVSDGVLYANKEIDVTEEILDSLKKSSQFVSSSN